jgi:phosphoglycolate phosphatase
MTKYDYTLWDWNGTLLDDVDSGVKIINEMLRRRNMKTLSGKNAYRKVFCFPVVDYYRAVGFDFKKERFEDLSEEYVELYNKQPLKLFDDAVTTLEAVKQKGVRQLILSASEKNQLKNNARLLNADRFFEDFLTLDNIYAASKTDVAKRWMTENGIDNKRVLIVGDTLHDLEVAEELNCDCALVDRGHQDLREAKRDGARVLTNVGQVVGLI